MDTKFLAGLALAAALPATLSSAEIVQDPQVVSECCAVADDGLRDYQYFVTVQNIDSGGIGYNSGYVSVDGMFFFPNLCETLLTFVDVRLHKFKTDCCDCKNNDWAGNFGVGFRMDDGPGSSVYGFNLFYDYRSNDVQFGQLGAGFEMLFPCFDFRVNAYYPYKNTKLVNHCLFDDYCGDFFATKDIFRTAFRGLDFEVEVPFCINECLDFYGAIGTYYYKGKICRSFDDFFGVRFRLGATFCKYFRVEGILTRDRRFKTRAQGLIAFTIPFGARCKSSPCYNPCAYERIRRNEIPVLDTFCRWKSNF